MDAALRLRGLFLQRLGYVVFKIPEKEPKAHQEGGKENYYGGNKGYHKDVEENPEDDCCIH